MRNFGGTGIDGLDDMKLIFGIIVVEEKDNQGRVVKVRNIYTLFFIFPS